MRLKFFRFILKHVPSTKYQLKLEYLFGFINSDLSPKTCKYCGSKDFIETITDKLDNMVMEKECKCKTCSHVIGYWVTGHWMP